MVVSLLTHTPTQSTAGPQAGAFPYWWLNKCSWSMQLQCSTIAWSLWISVHPQRIKVLWFSISFGHTPHEITARVDLQHMRVSQRAVLVNWLKSLCNYSRIFWGQRLSFFITADNVNNSQCALFYRLCVCWAACWVVEKEGLLDGPS